MRIERSAPSGLAELVERLDAGSAALAHYPRLPALQAMRDTWQKMHADSRLRIALEQAPAEGGPLNSTVLVHRMLDVMRDLSPDYLRHFVTYADTLAWLDPLVEAPPASVGAKPRRAPRKRSR